MALGRDRMNGLGVWVAAACYASRYLTDGFIPEVVAVGLGGARILARLVDVGLCDKVPGGYKLHDWLFSRQRYWGEPLPILHGEDGEIVAVEESELPVELPPMDDFRPTGTDDPDAPPQPPAAVQVPARATEEIRSVATAAQARPGVPHAAIG